MIKIGEGGAIPFVDGRYGARRVRVSEKPVSREVPGIVNGPKPLRRALFANENYN